MPVGRLGLGYEQAGVRRFVSLIGVQNTCDIFFWARVFDAQEALRIGFTSRVVPAARLGGAVRELTDAIADNAPLTLQATKLTVNGFLQHPEQHLPPNVQSVIDAANASDDYAEGVRAFAEKRPPRFVGK